MNEHQKKVAEYVKAQLSKGVEMDVIKKALVDNGWPKEEIDNLFNMIEPANVPIYVPASSEAYSSSGLMSSGAQKLDPKSVWVFFVSFIMRLIVPFIFIFFYFGLSSLGSRYDYYAGGYSYSPFLFFAWIALLVFGVFLVFLYIWARLSYKFYRYELNEAGFKKELGVIYKKYVTIPYDRIQNVDINRGILDRLLGLSTLNIQTAGYSGQPTSEGVLPGLTRDTAEKLRNELINRARKMKGQGL